MVSEERQRIIETNRSLRLIKTELENLLEKGVITEDAYDTFHSLLPSEAVARATAASPNPSSSTQSTPPVASLAALSIDRPVTTATADFPPPPAPPPAYPQSTASCPPPVEKSNAYGNPYQPPPGPPPAWGQNNGGYYQQQNNGGYYQPPTGPPPVWGQNNVSYYQQPAPGGYYQPPPGPPPQQSQSNPYNSSTPPMAVANQSSQQQEQQQEQKPEAGSNKFKDGAVNVGKKFGNATVFGAGATLGGNLMNSLF